MGAIVTEEDQTLGAESRRKTVFLIADIIHRDGERNWQAVTTEDWLTGQADLGNSSEQGKLRSTHFWDVNVSTVEGSQLRSNVYSVAYWLAYRRISIPLPLSIPNGDSLGTFG